MSKSKTQLEMVTMWGAFYNGAPHGNDRLLGVFKFKKDAAAAAKHQSSGSSD